MRFAITKRICDDFEDNLILAALDAVDANFLMTHDTILKRYAGDFCITAEEGITLLAELDA